MDTQSLEMDKMKQCTVLILNYNGADMLRRYLPSVIRYSPWEVADIVVADNGSTDSSLQVLANEFPQVKALPLYKNYGFAEGYNRAFAMVDTPYVVLLNSDVEVSKDWLVPMLDYMNQHPEVAAVQPKIRSWVNKRMFEHAGAAGGYVDRLGYPYCRGRVLSHVEEDHGQYDDEAVVLWTSGACMLTRREIYLGLGGLDADFFAHMEEIDLCWRMNMRGYILMCLPQSVVYHLGGGALAYNNPRKTYLNFRNNLLMLYKNLPSLRLLPTLFVRFFLDYVAAMQMLFTGKASHAKMVFRARIDFIKMLPHFRAKRKTNQEAASIKGLPKVFTCLSLFLLPQK